MVYSSHVGQKGYNNWFCRVPARTAMPHSSVTGLPSPEPCLCASPICLGQGGASVCPQSSLPQTVPHESVSHVSSEPQAHMLGPQNCAQTHLGTHCEREPDVHTFTEVPPLHQQTYARIRMCNTQEGSMSQHQHDCVAQAPSLAPPTWCPSSKWRSESLMRPCVFGISFRHCHLPTV